ncbi:hypothetical protein IAR55_002453 [Kwoniella newhampshirensis]|uniref:Uncharacterized protein n=1 Tax=Kwoniella newhampshirensis TaxID=1651941 RepID=A0AAW0Z106_9TREE
MSQTDRQPLLPTHINHSSSSRLSRPKISFPSSSSTSLGDETATLVANSDDGSSNSGARLGKGRHPSSTSSPLVASGSQGGKREGVPKLTRECLWSEIKCYGSYMLPPLLVFGVLVIAASLFAVGWKSGWFK